MADDSIGASLRRQHLKPVVALKLIHPIDFGGHGAVLDLPEKATAELAVYPPPAVFEGGHGDHEPFEEGDSSDEEVRKTREEDPEARELRLPCCRLLGHPIGAAGFW